MKYSNLTYIFLTLLLLLGGCVSDPSFDDDIRNAKVPDVKTSEDVVSASTSVTISGEVTSENGAPVTEAGFCWGTTSDVKLSTDNKANLGTRKAVFSSVKIEGFKENTLYYIRAYAVNAKGIGYGDVLSFTTTSGLGTVKTYSPDSIHATSIVCAGKILDMGEGDLTEYGFYLSKNAEPTASDSVFVCTRMAADSSFAVKITNLTPSTTYYIKAYARNAHGYFNGSSVEQFKTTDGLPTLEGLTKTNVGYTNATFSVKVPSEGDATVTRVGFCYSNSASPTINNDTVVAGKGTGTFTATLTNLKSQQQYYVRAFAINSFGVKYSEGTGMALITLSNLPTVTTANITSISGGQAIVGGEVLDEGMTSVITSGVCYSTSQSQVNITSGAVFRISSGKTVFSDTITALKGGTTYYVRAFAMNSSGVSYGDIVSFTTPSIFTTVASFTGGFLIEGTASFFSIGYRGYLLGGDVGSSYTSNFWNYNARDNVWQQLSSQPNKLTWQSVSSTTVAGIVFGGLDESGNATNSFVYYGTIDNRWHEMGDDSTKRPAAMYHAISVTSAKNVTYFFGGRRDDAILDEVWSFALQAKEWTKHGSFPIKQYGGVAVEINERLYVGLGQTSTSAISSSASNRLWSTDASAESWTEETTYPGAAVKCGVALNGCLYVVDANSYIWQYNTVSKVWTRKSQVSVREIHCMYALNGAIYIGLGSSTNTLIAYYPEWDN